MPPRNRLLTMSRQLGYNPAYQQHFDNTLRKVKQQAEARNQVRVPYSTDKVDWSRLRAMLNGYAANKTTASSDNTRVMNRPHKEYNQHLKADATQGAKAHAAWRKDNPAAAKAGLVLGASPFIAMAAPFAIKAAPYMSGSYLIGNAGRAIAGNVGSQVGGAIGTVADLGLSGMGIYNGVKTIADSNTDLFDKTVGGLSAVASTFPLYNTYVSSLPKLRSSLYFNLTPKGYAGHIKELYRTAKDYLNPFKTFDDMEYPKWYMRKLPGLVDWHDGTYDLSPELITIARDASYRRYLGLPKRGYDRTYIENGDGTLSYNLPWLERLNYNTNGIKPLVKNSREELFPYIKDEGIRDMVTTSHGGVNLQTIPNTNKYVVTDTWDLNPFSHKFDLGKLIGSKPFKLKQTFTDE